MLLLATAVFLVLVVLKEIDLCWQHPIQGEMLEVCPFQSALMLEVSLIICTQGKLYEVLQGLDKLWEQRLWQCLSLDSHPHQGYHVAAGMPFVEMPWPVWWKMLPWAASIIIFVECSKLSPAHLRSLQADCSQAEATGPRQVPGPVLPTDPCDSSSVLHCLPGMPKNKLPLLIADSLTTDTESWFWPALTVTALWTWSGFCPLWEGCSGCSWCQKNNLTSLHWAYACASTPMGNAQLSPLHMEFRMNSLRFNLSI